MTSDKARNWSRDMSPVAAVLFAPVVFSFFYGDVAQLTNWQTAWKAPLRFLRFASSLCIPLFILPGIYNFFIRRRSAVLFQIERTKELKVEPIRHWLFRPFQGIGIGLLFGTKLLGILQLVAGPSMGSSLLIPEGHFQLGRLLLITLITVFVSLLWTLDDMGIRYFNRRDQELKMIGKYVGTAMPVIFGFYGIINLMGNYSVAQAFLFAFKIAFVLYPPLAVFAVHHTYFLSSRMAQFSKSYVRRGIIEQRG